MLLKLDIEGRNELGLYLNSKGLFGMGVEVGTHRGEFANEILALWEAGTLYCVDPWANSPDYEWQAKFLKDSEDRDQDFAQAKYVLQPYGGRAVCMRGLSNVLVRAFLNESLDFVYLDGDHTEPAVTQDIQLWWPKVKPGGLLLGHDIVMSSGPDDNWALAIQPAVFKFAEQQGRDVYLIPERYGHSWSYCIHK